MRAEVKGFIWPDLDQDLSVPPGEQRTLLQFIAGPLGESGEEAFQVVVCTVEGLSELVARDGIVVGRHYLFVESINVRRVEEFVRDRLRRIDGDTWAELADKIGRIGLWEFEDYVDG